MDARQNNSNSSSDDDALHQTTRTQGSTFLQKGASSSSSSSRPTSAVLALRGAIGRPSSRIVRPSSAVAGGGSSRKLAELSSSSSRPPSGLQSLRIGERTKQSHSPSRLQQGGNEEMQVIRSFAVPQPLRPATIVVSADGSQIPTSTLAEPSEALTIPSRDHMQSPSTLQYRLCNISTLMPFVAEDDISQYGLIGGSSNDGGTTKKASRVFQSRPASAFSLRSVSQAQGPRPQSSASASGGAGGGGRGSSLSHVDEGKTRSDRSFLGRPVSAMARFPRCATESVGDRAQVSTRSSGGGGGGGVHAQSAYSFSNGDDCVQSFVSPSHVGSEPMLLDAFGRKVNPVATVDLVLRNGPFLSSPYAVGPSTYVSGGENVHSGAAKQGGGDAALRSSSSSPPPLSKTLTADDFLQMTLVRGSVSRPASPASDWRSHSASGGRGHNDTKIRNQLITHSRDVRVYGSAVGGGLETAEDGDCAHSLAARKARENGWFGVNRRPASALRRGSPMWSPVGDASAISLVHSRPVDQKDAAKNALRKQRQLLTEPIKSRVPHKVKGGLGATSSNITLMQGALRRDWIPSRDSSVTSLSGTAGRDGQRQHLPRQRDDSTSSTLVRRPSATDTAANVVDGHYYGHSATTNDKLEATEKLTVSVLDDWVPAKSLGEEVANAVTALWSGKKRQPFFHPSEQQSEVSGGGSRGKERGRALDISKMSSYDAAEAVQTSSSKTHTIDPYAYKEDSSSEDARDGGSPEVDYQQAFNNISRRRKRQGSTFVDSDGDGGGSLSFGGRAAAAAKADAIAAAFAGAAKDGSSHSASHSSANDPVAKAAYFRSIITGPVGLPTYRTSRYNKDAAVSWDVVLETPLDVTERILEERARFEKW